MTEMAPPVCPQALLFDWDNTLVDTLPLIRFCLNETLTALGRDPWSAEDVRRRIHRSARDFFPELFGDGWQQAFDLYASIYRAHHLEWICEMPGATDFLARLRDAGMPLALISNKRGHFLRAEVAHLGLAEHFLVIVGAEDTPRDKPDPAPFHFAMQNNVMHKLSQMWYIGDTVTDMHFARNCGLTAVLLRSIPPEEDIFGTCPPDIHASTFDALTKVLHKTGFNGAA
jgi:phosphoglycolate phosphatase